MSPEFARHPADRRWNLAAAALLALGFIGWQVASGGAMVRGFGAENGNVAAALASGRGFADPFGTPSGPTAWVPPVYAGLMAGVFCVLGIKTAAAAVALVILAAIGTGLTALLMFETLGLESRHRWPKAAFAGLFSALILFHAHSGYDYFHSSAALVTLETAALLHALTRLIHRCGEGGLAWILLAALNGLMPLTHVGIGLSCVVGTCGVGAGLLIRARSRGAGWRRVAFRTAACLAVFGLAVGGWTVRNFRAFGRFIPIKSNGPFEMRLVQDNTRDGILSFAVILRAHPIANPELRAAYTRMGETDFLKSYRIMDGPPGSGGGLGRYLRFCGNRLFNAFCYARDPNDVRMADPALGTDDNRLLVSAGLAVPRWNNPGPVLIVWTCLDWPPAGIRARLNGLPLEHREKVWQDWIQTRTQFDRDGATWEVVLSGLALAGIPTLCFLGSAGLCRQRLGTAWWLAAGILGVALLPNIMITHDAHHQFLQVGLHAFLMTGFVLAVVRTLGRAVDDPSAVP